MKDLIGLLSWVYLTLTWLAGLYGVARRYGFRDKVIDRILAEGTLAYWPLAAVHLYNTMISDEAAWIKATNVTMVILGWFWIKENDDDRWKRRRKKLVEKVSIVGGRLSITPA